VPRINWQLDSLPRLDGVDELRFGRVYFSVCET